MCLHARFGGVMVFERIGHLYRYIQAMVFANGDSACHRHLCIFLVCNAQKRHEKTLLMHLFFMLAMLSSNCQKRFDAS